MSVLTALLDLYAYVDDRFDLDHVLHYQHAAERVQEHARSLTVLAGVAFPALSVSPVRAPLNIQQPIEVIVDVRDELDGFFTAIVRNGATGRLMVVSPQVSSIDGAIAAARHMHQTGELIAFTGFPEPREFTPVPVVPVEGTDVQASS